MNADTHYAQFGWREGRSTGSLFDSGYYLHANADVQAANVNPVEHYLTYGWKEGRDPSPLFDTDFYLTRNPDVAAARLNPLEHYLEFGRFEGRDPNALFDSAFYLQQNPDLAELGGSPLDHYLESGARAGLAVSRQFITKVYLAQNPDVAAAGVNPLAHYLEWGRHEGRPLSSGTPATITGLTSGVISEDSRGPLHGLITVQDIDPLESGFPATFGGWDAIFHARFWNEEGVLQGYGSTLTLKSDGFWTFTPDTDLYQSLRAGETTEEVFTLRTIGQDLVTVTIQILGQNDPARFFGSTSARLDERASPHAYGELRVVDPDTDESGLLAGIHQGTYGTLTLAESGRWDYLFAGNAEQGITPGVAHAALTDSITIRSLDGTEQAISISIAALDAVL
ncbi:VCBS domain-containing protein [Teichococcus aestuarii]|nr:VCBS domain-containing protein [Pseudoroseomonas aestuarii]